MKRIVIVHGWDGSPEGGWIPWLKQQLESRNFEVLAPQMPGAQNPTQSGWVTKLTETISRPNEDTYLVGHSLGCITILRYLESLSGEERIGGAVFVAGFVKDLTHEGYKGELATFFAEPIQWKRIKSKCDEFVIINSDNDPYVPTENHELLLSGLDASKAVMEHNMSHFSGDDDITELPVVLDKLLTISQ